MIQLNATELKIKGLLINVANFIKAKKQKSVELRVAGGWVRDKILGKESHDVDIVLDNMTGFEFANEINEYLSNQGEKSIHIAKIESNPEKSKHLETATLKLFGQFVDFVNLRTEIYSQDSRIPTMAFGSPYEDAIRRDITINTLFYNLHTEKIEDFTNQGLSDIKKRLIRTPLEPFKTFVDDPLRVLRVIRFASRLDYTISPDIFQAVLQKEIHDPFFSKISRERVGNEIEKMLLGPDPLRSIRLISDFKFFDAVFILTESTENYPQSPQIRGVQIATSLDWLLSHSKFMDLVQKEFIETDFDNHRLCMYLASALSDFNHISVKDIVLSGLKLSVQRSDYTSKLIELLKSTLNFVSLFEKSALTRKDIGLFIRSIGSKPLGSAWYMAFVYAAAYELYPLFESLEPESIKSNPQIMTPNPEQAEQIVSKYINLFSKIISLNLQSVHLMKPLLDGHQIAKIHEMRANPLIRIILDKLIDYQLDNPDITVDECRIYVEIDLKVFIESNPLYHKHKLRKIDK